MNWWSKIFNQVGVFVYFINLFYGLLSLIYCKYAMNHRTYEFYFYISGLCGTYDFNTRNDFMLREGTVSGNVSKFGNSWKVE